MHSQVFGQAVANRWGGEKQLSPLISPCHLLPCRTVLWNWVQKGEKAHLKSSSFLIGEKNLGRVRYHWKEGVNEIVVIPYGWHHGRTFPSSHLPLGPEGQSRHFLKSCPEKPRAWSNSCSVA